MVSVRSMSGSMVNGSMNGYVMSGSVGGSVSRSVSGSVGGPVMSRSVKIVKSEWGVLAAASLVICRAITAGFRYYYLLLHCCLICFRAYTADFRYYYFGADSENNGDRAKAKAFALPGSTHAGFTSLAVALWRGGLRTLLDSSIEGGVTHVSVAGHSLGAGVATLLSYRMQVRSHQPQQGGPPPRVQDAGAPSPTPAGRSPRGSGYTHQDAGSPQEDVLSLSDALSRTCKTASVLLWASQPWAIQDVMDDCIAIYLPFYMHLHCQLWVRQRPWLCQIALSLSAPP